MTDNKTPKDCLTIDGDFFKALINEDGQYSIWPANKNTPDGWLDQGFEGSKSDCSNFIDQQWLDMRPKLLRGFPHKK
jgi:MbtH protein